MRISIKKFGDILTSRPEGREAFLATRAYLRPATPEEPIELDFEGVHVLTPSWADEFISGLQSEYGRRVICLPSKNPSVTLSLQMLDKS